MRLLVGAVGIESNNGRDFKDLRGMHGNFKSLKRNDEGRYRTLIAPSKLPRLSPSLGATPQQLSALGPNLAARMAGRHHDPTLSNRSRKKQ